MSNENKTSCSLGCGCFGCALEIIGLLTLIALWNYRHEIWFLVTGGLIK